MFIVVMSFGANRGAAGTFAAQHKAWLKKGMEDGVFALFGTIAEQRGGTILAHDLTREALEARLREDPFVTEGVVEVEILEVAPAATDPRLAFLAAA